MPFPSIEKEKWMKIARNSKKKQNKKHRNLICTTSLSWISEEQTKRVIQFKQMEYIFYLKFRSIPLNYLASICFVLFCFVLFCLNWFCSWTIAASRFHGLFQFNLWFNFQPFFDFFYLYSSFGHSLIISVTTQTGIQIRLLHSYFSNKTYQKYILFLFYVKIRR